MSLKTVLVFLSFVAFLALPPDAAGQGLRKVVIDQDSAGPGGTDMQAILALINSPQTEVLGITVVTGDQWRDEEVAHTLRLLEIIGRTEIPVLPGAVFPIVNSKEAVAEWEKKYGKVVYQGAWNSGKAVHGPWEIPSMPEGKAATRPAKEDAAHFLVRMVRQFPREITVYAAGPLTNLALAQTIDPEFASLARELVLMGGAIRPVSDDPKLKKSPHREFNFWMDPEATHAVLRAPWARIVVTTTDISAKTRMDKTLISAIAKGTTASAQYVSKYATENPLWDELAAVSWLDPTIITKTKKMYLDVSLDHGATYGDTLAWDAGEQPVLHGPIAEIQEDLDLEKFYRQFIGLMTASTPRR